MWCMSDQWWKLCTERWYGNNLSGDTGNWCYRSGFPVYYYTWTSLMKRTLDRTFALQSLLHNKKFFLLSAGAAPEEQYMQIMLDSYRQYIFCFEGNEDGGYVMASEWTHRQMLKERNISSRLIKWGRVFERNLIKYHFKTFHKIFVNIFDWGDMNKHSISIEFTQ